MKELISLLKERKNYYKTKSESLLLSDEYDHDEFEDAVFMYGNYINVIADMQEIFREEQ